MSTESSLHKIVDTKEKADNFMEQLKALSSKQTMNKPYFAKYLPVEGNCRHNNPCLYDIPPLPLRQQLDQLTDNQRVELFSHYCKHCGSKNIKCQHQNDE